MVTSDSDSDKMTKTKMMGDKIKKYLKEILKDLFGNTISSIIIGIFCLGFIIFLIYINETKEDYMPVLFTIIALSLTLAMFCQRMSESFSIKKELILKYKYLNLSRRLSTSTVLGFLSLIGIFGSIKLAENYEIVKISLGISVLISVIGLMIFFESLFIFLFYQFKLNLKIKKKLKELNNK